MNTLLRLQPDPIARILMIVAPSPHHKIRLANANSKILILPFSPLLSQANLSTHEPIVLAVVKLSKMICASHPSLQPVLHLLQIILLAPRLHRIRIFSLHKQAYRQCLGRHHLALVPVREGQIL